MGLQDVDFQLANFFNGLYKVFKVFIFPQNCSS